MFSWFKRFSCVHSEKRIETVSLKDTPKGKPKFMFTRKTCLRCGKTTTGPTRKFDPRLGRKRYGANK